MGCERADLVLSSLDGDADVSAEDLRWLAGHLRSCGDCCEVAAALAEGSLDGEIAGSGRVLGFLEGAARAQRRAVRLRRLAVAAAVALGAGLALGRIPSGRPGRIQPLLEAQWMGGASGGERICRVGETISPRMEGTLTFADGSEVSLSPGCAAAIEPPGEGERLRVRIDRGEARFRVAHEAGGVTVRGPLGQVQVVGTVFHVALRTEFAVGDTEDAATSALGAARPADAAPVLMEVQVDEGSVSVVNARGARTVGRGQCAYLGPEGPPDVQAIGPVAARWARSLADRMEEEFLRGDVQGATRALAMLRHQGREGVAEAVRRVGASGEPSLRIRWFRALVSLDPGEARATLEHLQQEARAAGTEPDEVLRRMERTLGAGE